MKGWIPSSPLARDTRLASPHSFEEELQDKVWRKPDRVWRCGRQETGMGRQLRGTAGTRMGRVETGDKG